MYSICFSQQCIIYIYDSVVVAQSSLSVIFFYLFFIRCRCGGVENSQQTTFNCVPETTNIDSPVAVYSLYIV